MFTFDGWKDLIKKDAHQEKEDTESREIIDISVADFGASGVLKLEFSENLRPLSSYS